MSKRNYTAEQIVSMLREEQVHLSKGQNITDVCRCFGIRNQTYYLGRKEHGGLRLDQVKG